MTRDLFLVTLSLFGWMVGEGMFTYFQSIYLAQLGANPVTIGVIFSAMGIAMAISQIPAGYLSDRIGRRPLIWASWLLGLVAAVVMASATTLGWFVCGLIIYDLTSFVMAPLNSYITTTRGKFSTGRALTLASAGGNLGAVIGPLLGGQIGEAYGLPTIYKVAAGIFIFSTVIILSISKQPVDRKNNEDQMPFQPWKNTNLLAFLGISAVVTFSTYLPQPLTSNFLQADRGISLSSIGQLGSISSLGSALIALIIGRLRPEIGYFLGQIMVASFSMLLWKGTGIGWFSIGYFFLGGYRLCRSMVMALLHPHIPAGDMGLAFGTIETVNASALILAPLVAGLIYDHQPEAVYPVSLVLIGIGLLLSLNFLPRQKKDVKTAIRESE